MRTRTQTTFTLYTRTNLGYYLGYYSFLCLGYVWVCPTNLLTQPKFSDWARVWARQFCPESIDIHTFVFMPVLAFRVEKGMGSNMFSFVENGMLCSHWRRCCRTSTSPPLHCTVVQCTNQADPNRRSPTRTGMPLLPSFPEFVCFIVTPDRPASERHFDLGPALPAKKASIASPSSSLTVRSSDIIFFLRFPVVVVHNG